MNRRLRKAPLYAYTKSILDRCICYAKESPRLSQHLPGLPHEPVAWITIIGMPQMKALQERYRNKSGVTDVLSFPTARPFRDQGQLGDIMICGAQAKKQAKEWGHSLETECAILVVHGFLHLLGYDHEGSPAAARDMRRREEDLLAFLFPKQHIPSLLDRSGE
jgi:rRNA maturation RNase YbeY